MIQLQSRDRQDEWMDQPDIDASLHAEALRGLARVNRISGTVASIFAAIKDVSGDGQESLRVLDVACGGGDIAIGLKLLAEKKHVPLEVVGLDISTTALDRATRQATDQNAAVEFVQGDVLSGSLPEGFDIVYSSLFLHHLENEQITSLLGAMRSVARRRIVINDLLRTRLGYVLAKWGIRFLTRSKVCHVDGPLSVRAALTLDEIQQLARQAGLDRVTIKRKWPERFLMVGDTR